MQYLVWLWRTLLFFALLGFAVKNDQPVTLRYFFAYQWDTSLVLALLCFFAAGVVAGILAVLGVLLRQRRELAALRRAAKLREQQQATATQPFPVQPS